jgi:MFS superfamily sulfate permease-like transporter
MSANHHQKEISTGLKGLAQNWRSDLMAAVSVALIALPLSLGIALAAGAPAMAGIISAVVGGLVTTLYRGGHISVNGPAKGVIAVILLGIALMDDGKGQAFNYVLAAIVVAGAIQALLGVLKLGRFADVFHSSVIQGLLAAIGIIIFAKQIHVAFGSHADKKATIVQNLVDAIVQLPQANPFVVIISLVGLLLTLFHSKISYKLFHILPTPMWVIALSIPFVYAFNFFEAHTMSFLGRAYEVGPELLLKIPDNIMDSIMHPNFGKINTLNFWTTVFSLLMITSIESLAIAKAVDKIDPYRRKTDLNKDLTGIGLSTVAAGFLGGLPIIAVIIRSTVNIQNGAKTKWSNMYQGIILLLFIVLLAPVMTKVPLCAFAILLVYTGFKLASPSVFKEVYKLGIEQLIFFVFTMVLTLYTNLLIGLFGGLLIALGTHILLARVPVTSFFQMLFNSGTKLLKKSSDSYELRIKGIANFLSILNLKKIMQDIPDGSDVKINVSSTRILDLTVQEYLYDFKKEHALTGGKVRITGMEHHIASAKHKLAMKSLIEQAPVRLSPRQQRIKKLATKNNWVYRQEVEWDTSTLQNFDFFESKPLEYKENVISGTFPECHNERWEISDITFDEGAMSAKEVFHTTAEVIHLDKEIPRFVLEQEGFFDKIFHPFMAFRGQKDIDFPGYTEFSKRFLVRGESQTTLSSFFSEDLINFLLANDVYHIESNGNSLLIFRSLRVARTEDIEQMISFSEDFVKLIE